MLLYIYITTNNIHIYIYNNKQFQTPLFIHLTFRTKPFVHMTFKHKVFELKTVASSYYI